MADKREFLAVPYEERNAARAAGARWDATLKSWYVGEGADRARLARWMSGADTPTIAPRDEFIEAMTAHGLRADGQHPIGDGQSHRVPVEGDKQTPSGRFPRPSGRYALHLDGHPAGYVRNFRKGTYASWKSSGFRLPPHELAALRAEIGEREAENAAALRKSVEAAADRAQRRTAGLVQVETPTGYMIAKGLSPTRGALTDKRGQATFLPAVDIAGKQWTLQTIRPDGTKLFQKDSRKDGTFHVVDGDLPALEHAAVLVIAEGYATAVIVGEVVNGPTIAAFDAGNLGPVASALRSRFPDKPILITGDDDHGVEMREGHNPGREKATAAAQAVDGAAVFPRFGPGEQESDPRGFTDFHDLAMRSRLGREGVRLQVTIAISELMCPPNGKQMETMMAKEDVDPEALEKKSEPPVNLTLPIDMPKVGDPQNRAAIAGNAISAPSGDETEVHDRTANDRPDVREPIYAVGDVPSDLATRYRVERARWRRQDDYYEGRSTDRPAFHDQGRRLVSELESAAVIADMMAIAEHRGWRAIEVHGTPEFRREAWLRAQQAGLEAKGYKPSEPDRAEAFRRTAAHGTQAGPSRAPETTGPPEPASNRLFLAVPFAEKEEAKAVGAKWDQTAKAWFVDEAERASVARWVPERSQAKADRVIARDRPAREQMRTIEAVVSKTLADDPEAAKRVLETGREALAAKIERGEPIAAPMLRRDGPSPEQSSRTPEDSPSANRRPRERSRVR